MLKVIKSLSAAIPHPEDPDFVWTVRLPDLVERAEMAETFLRLSDREWVTKHLREATEDVVRALASVTVSIQGAIDEDGKPLDFGGDPVAAIRAIVAGPAPLTVPGKDEDPESPTFGKEIRRPLSGYVAQKLLDRATFGLDPEGKALPAPQTAS